MSISPVKLTSTKRKRTQVASHSKPKKVRRKSVGEKKNIVDCVSNKCDSKISPALTNNEEYFSTNKQHKPLVALRSYDSRTEEIAKKYNIPIQLVQSNVSNIIKLVEENPKLKSDLFAERFPIFLQLNVWKIPKGIPKLMRIELQHSLLETDDEVCLIVPDVRGIKNKYYDQHLEHYEELLKENGVSGIKKIMTLHELKSEYDTFELKRGLVELYDLFLVDGRISGRVLHQLGKIFYKKRKVPTPVKMDSKLKEHIETALKKSLFQVHSKGDSFMVQIGHNKMTERELVENVLLAIDDLNKKFPGGINNMKSINIFAQRGSSLPIYVALADPNTVKVPILKKKKPKLHKDVHGELTTQFNHKVTVTPAGFIHVEKVPDDK